MSFGTYARRVRDPALPYGRRVSALAGCVQHYQPVGFKATFVHLEQVAGPFRHDEAALLRAVDLLTASRERWLAEVRAYATRRSTAKRLGHRTPSAAGRFPMKPAHWYGDSRAAALTALGYLLRRRAKGRPIRGADADPEVVRLAATCLAGGGHLDAAGRQEQRRLQLRFAGPGAEIGSRWVLRLIAEASRPGPAS
ncbi:hypothetical protein [Actinoplanes awajinensis]|uniref:Uncharacterized protein n=1 Tax=Actinoplanes awajinensis subsp. mycoplanecinus TaxID=135947 RepID=A0A101JPU5_9ACTN|nr:hypothetical protein [Actinoplanes awajinensis]KUL30920.1 hypothetical protein ADL15_23495 [Actinoplanes awajinensis subsp. mycoplanecinus]